MSFVDALTLTFNVSKMRLCNSYKGNIKNIIKMQGLSKYILTGDSLS